MNPDSPQTPSASPATLTAVPVAGVVDMLRRSGAKYASVEAIQADLAAGAPANADGTINLLEYAAWLVERMAHGD